MKPTTKKTVAPRTTTNNKKLSLSELQRAHGGMDFMDIAKKIAYPVEYVMP